MPSVKQPQQKRSHASFSKVLATTVSLLAEKGLAGVTIAEVSERAGVSVGTIYGRVGSRANLLRAAHEQELARLQASLDARLARLQDEGRNTIEGIIGVYVSEMALNASIIRALIELTSELNAESDAGPASWRASRQSITSALLTATDVDTGHCTGDLAAWIFEVIFATTVHRLEHPEDEGVASVDFTDKLTATVRSLMTSGMS